MIILYWILTNSFLLQYMMILYIIRTDIFFCLYSCWYVFELIVSSTVFLSVLNILRSICLEHVNRFLVGLSRSKILHRSLLQTVTSTERKWISLAPPISLDDSFFETMFLLCCVNFNIACRLTVPSEISVSCSFGINLCFAA